MYRVSRTPILWSAVVLSAVLCSLLIRPWAIREAQFILTWLVRIAPPVQTGAFIFIIIFGRLRGSRQPAFLVFLVSESLIELLMSQRQISYDVAAFVQMAVASGFLLAELAKLNRIPLRPECQALLAGLAMCLCAMHAGSQPWTRNYQILLFLCDMRIARALAAVAILLYRWRCPAFEHHADSYRNRVYRFGVTALLLTEAYQASFVKGGPAMWFFSYTPQRWTWVGITSCASVIAVVVGMAAAMAVGCSGKKRAALRKSGKVATGLIEMVA